MFISYLSAICREDYEPTMQLNHCRISRFVRSLACSCVRSLRVGRGPNIWKTIRSSFPNPMDEMPMKWHMANRMAEVAVVSDCFF